MEPTILIVDDSIETWQLLSSQLRTHRYRPIWAADAIQAITAARKHHPAAILLDLGMPGGDGFLVLERLKGNRLLSDIPVIIVTVQDPLVSESRARRLGAVAYLQKPVKGDELIATVRGLIELTV